MKVQDALRSVLIHWMLLAAIMMGCQTTPWNGGLPPAGTSLSLPQRQVEFKKFEMTHLTPIGFTVLPEIGGKPTNLNSFAPVIEKVYPAGRSRLETIENSSKAFYLAAGTSVTILFAPYFFALSALGMAGAWVWQYATCGDLQLEYNQALRHNAFTGSSKQTMRTDRIPTRR